MTYPLFWLLVFCLYKEFYLQIFKCVTFSLQGCGREWDGWAGKPVNHASLVAVVLSWSTIAVYLSFYDCYVLSHFLLDISVGIKIIGLSKNSSFFFRNVAINIDRN